MIWIFIFLKLWNYLIEYWFGNSQHICCNWCLFRSFDLKTWNSLFILETLIIVWFRNFGYLKRIIYLLNNSYWGSFRLFNKIRKNHSIESSFSFKKKPLESQCNPLANLGPDHWSLSPSRILTPTKQPDWTHPGNSSIPGLNAGFPLHIGTNVWALVQVLSFDSIVKSTWVKILIESLSSGKSNLFPFWVGLSFGNRLNWFFWCESRRNTCFCALCISWWKFLYHFCVIKGNFRRRQ